MPRVRGSRGIRSCRRAAASLGQTSPIDVYDLVAEHGIESRIADGGLRIEAPPEAAQWMAVAFETMATLMRSAATTTKPS